MQKKLMFDLQRFADASGGDTDQNANASGADGENQQGGKPDQDEANEANEVNETDETSFDEFLKNPNNRAEFDRRMSKALKTRENSLKEQHKNDIEAAIAEALKTEKMSAEERYQYDLKKLKEENENLKAAAKRVAFSKTATELFRAEGISATSNILDLVVAQDEETTKANVQKLMEIINEQIKAAEIERAKGKTPKNFNSNKPEKTEFEKRIEKYL